mgnify:CR=1 FL=1|tara:strand:- start:1420 stop:1719 length:300 start_codon:yes stop_codon:yes gene_type:complete
MMPIDGEKICIGEPAYEVGSLFRWSEDHPSVHPDAFVITDVTPIGQQLGEYSPVDWEWQYQVHYLRTPVQKTFMGETEIKSLIKTTELQLLSKGGKAEE